MRDSILRATVAKIMGVIFIVAFGYFEWNVLIPKGILPVWIHLILNVFLLSTAICLIASLIISLTVSLITSLISYLRHPVNSIES